MKFKKYQKIHRLGADENDGILIGDCYIQEKIDGANVSIWMDDGDIRCGSRSQDVTDGEFNGFTQYVKEHTGIQKLLTDYPEMRLYAEWLVRHTVSYNETAYKKMYLFDVEVDDTLLDIEEVYAIAKEYGIDTPHLFAKIHHPTLEQIHEFVGKSTLGEHGEGVVIKNNDYVNKFGDKEYAKVVTEKFKEANSIVFGGNNKHSESYWELYVVNKYVTLGRVRKIMEKLQPQINEKLDMTHTARIINTVYHDMLTEEIWDIQKKVPWINFKTLQRLATRKAARMYHDILHDHISVAYEK